MHNFLIYNSKIIKINEACIKGTDRGFLLGDAIFETLRAYNKTLPFWDCHIERLKDGMETLGMPSGDMDFENIKEIAMELICLNNTPDAYVRLTVSRGESNQGILPKWGKDKFNWTLITKALPLNLDSDQKEGIGAIISLIRKNNYSPTASLKSVNNYLDMIFARHEAMQKGKRDSILLDIYGYVAEASTSNIFWINKDIIFTPSLDLPILPGITRLQVLKIAEQLGYALYEGRYPVDELLNAEEIFICNSICEIIPVVDIDNKMVNDGGPGNITKRLQKIYKEKALR